MSSPGFATLCSAAVLPNGVHIGNTDSRSSRVVNGGLLDYSDDKSKIQLIGPYYVLFSGNSVFGNMALTNVRIEFFTNWRESLLDLASFARLVRTELRSVLTSISVAKCNCPSKRVSFIIGSTLVDQKTLKLKERKVATITDLKLTFSLVGIIGEPAAVRALWRIRWGCWLNLPLPQSLPFFVHELTKAYSCSPLVGGPIDLFTFQVEQSGSETVTVEQNHKLIIGEVFCKQLGVLVPRYSNLPLEVSDYIAQKVGIPAGDVGPQISPEPYAGGVEEMLMCRLVGYDGLDVKWAIGYDEVAAPIFDTNPYLAQ